jgi:hypothetical protein
MRNRTASSPDVTHIKSRGREPLFVDLLCFSYDDMDFINPPSEDHQSEFLAHEMMHN